jgi:hypothetical protein
VNAPIQVERHPATAKAWAWLESRTPRELSHEKRDKIAGTLMEVDAELHALDRGVSVNADQPTREPTPLETALDKLRHRPTFRLDAREVDALLADRDAEPTREQLTKALLNTLADRDRLAAELAKARDVIAVIQASEQIAQERDKQLVDVLVEIAGSADTRDTPEARLARDALSGMYGDEGEQ